MDPNLMSDESLSLVHIRYVPHNALRISCTVLRLAKSLQSPLSGLLKVWSVLWMSLNEH